jgi:hypothetical protein
MTNLEPTKWGKIYWDLVHTLVGTVDPDKYGAVENKAVKIKLIQTIINICANLPKSSCNITNLTVPNLKILSHRGLKYFLRDMHNTVNEKLGKPTFSIDVLNKYDDILFGLTNAINSFWFKHEQLNIIINPQIVSSLLEYKNSGGFT